MSFSTLQQQAQLDWQAFQQPEQMRILIGSATCGRAAGSLEVKAAFATELLRHDLTAATEIYEVGCLGMCYAEVLVEIRGKDGRRVLYQGVEPKQVPALVETHLVGGEIYLPLALALMAAEADSDLPAFDQLPIIQPQVRIVLRNCGIIDPTRINHYLARGGYSGLARALTLSPEQVIDEIKTSGLRGRGGAGFPTGVKWGFARNSISDQKYVICNADEGDPGAFMDRSVLEGDPHAVLEGLLIAGYAIGASIGYVYCRAEYPLAIERLQTAIAQMRELGSWAPTSWAQASALRSKSKKAPAPLSAAKRPR